MSQLDDFLEKHLYDEDLVIVHDDLGGDDFLAHYGVKGMRWGVRQKAERAPEALKHSETPDVGDFLAHYGVKGMKWGVRRANPTKGSTRPKDRHRTTIEGLLEARAARVTERANRKIRRENARAEIARAKTAARAADRMEDNARAEAKLERLQGKRDKAVAKATGRELKREAKNAKELGREAKRFDINDPHGNRSIENRQKVLQNRRKLSDEAVKEFTARIDAEKRLKTAIEEDISPGKAHVKKTLKDGADATAKKVIPTVGTLLIAKAFSKAGHPNVAKALRPAVKAAKGSP